MLKQLQNAFSPHYCCSCGKIGGILCDYCKYDIIQEQSIQCFACLRPADYFGGVCKACEVHYSKGWFVGVHRGALREVIAKYKFKRARATNVILADLLYDTLPELPAGTVVTCVPTVRAHVRERGYDHAELVAKGFARLRGLSYSSPLSRATNTMQRGAKKAVRLQQAKSAFKAKNIQGGTYLLIDDVSTTGATMNYAAKALKDAGAFDVWVAAVTREPLD